MDTPFLPLADATDATTAASERYCINCGYPLRGLPHTGNCPECGTSIALSLAKSILQTSSPDYLRTLLRGVTFILVAFVVEFLVGIAALAFGVFVSSTGSQLALDGSTLITSSASFLLAVLSLLGYWLYTQPDPAFIALEPARSSRVIVRVSVIGKATCAFVAFIAAIVISGPPQPPLSFLVGAINILSFVVTLSLFFSSLRYTRWIASRIPDDRLFARASRYMWLLPLIGFVGFALAMSGPIMLFSSAQLASLSTFYVLMILGSLCILAAVILYFSLLYGIRRHLHSIVTTGSAARS